MKREKLSCLPLLGTAEYDWLKCRRACVHKYVMMLWWASARQFQCNLPSHRTRSLLLTVLCPQSTNGRADYHQASRWPQPECSSHRELSLRTREDGETLTKCARKIRSIRRKVLSFLVCFWWSKKKKIQATRTRTTKGVTDHRQKALKPLFWNKRLLKNWSPWLQKMAIGFWKKKKSITIDPRGPDPSTWCTSSCSSLSQGQTE